MSSFAYVQKERHVGYPADVIPLQYHGHMLLDERRTGAFERAISTLSGSGSMATTAPEDPTISWT